MKTILAFFITAGLFAGSVTPKDGFRKFYRDYKHEAGVINFAIPSFVLKLAANGQDEEVKMLAGSTNKVRVMIKDENSQGLYKQIDKYLTTGLYKPFLYVKDGESYVKIVARVANNEINEVIIVVNNRESFVAVQLKGKYTIGMISELAGIID